MGGNCGPPATARRLPLGGMDLLAAALVGLDPARRLAVARRVLGGRLDAAVAAAAGLARGGPVLARLVGRRALGDAAGLGDEEQLADLDSHGVPPRDAESDIATII